MEHIEAAVIIAGIVLFVGLYGEYRDHIAKVPQILVMVGVGGEVMGAVLHSLLAARLRLLEWRKDTEHEEEMARLRQRTTESAERLAATQLRLAELQKRQEPRRLSYAERDRIRARLKGKSVARAEVLHLRDDLETLELALDLSLTIFQAGWNVGGMPEPLPTDRPFPAAVAAGGSMTGVTLVMRHEGSAEDEAAREVLFEALAEFSTLVGGLNKGTSRGVDDGTIRIVVAAKPLPDADVWKYR